MMNKVLVKLYVPMLDVVYDVFIPVNEMVWKVNKLIVKSVGDLSDGFLSVEKNYVLVNMNTGKVYNNNEIIISTDIRNSAEIALIEV